MTVPSYPALLRLPSLAPAFAATSLTRVQYGGISLALLLAVRDRTGSFAVAGLAVGGFAVASVSMPFKARWVDRHGQARVLPVLGVGYGLGLALVLLLPVPGAVLAGVLAPPVGPSMRARWSAHTRGAARARAFALDTASEEALYVVAPAVAGLLVAVSPAACLLGFAAVGAAGATALGLAPGAPPSAGPATSSPGVLRPPPGLAAALVVAVGFGAGTATLEFAVAARFADRDDAVVGVLLGTVAVGSVVGGLLWGRRSPGRTAAGRLVGLLTWLAGGAVAVGLVGPPPALAVVLALTGLAVSPVLVVLYVAADERTDPARRTEANTWLATAVNAGGAVGAAMGGAVVTHTGSAWLAAGAAIPLLLATIVVRRV